MCVWNVFCSFVVLCVAVCTDCEFCFVFLSVFFPPPVFPISLPASSLTLTVFLCCYLSTAHQASPAGYAAEPLPHRTQQPGIHWYAVRCDPLPPPPPRNVFVLLRHIWIQEITLSFYFNYWSCIILEMCLNYFLKPLYAGRQANDEITFCFWHNTLRGKRI